MVQRLVLLGFAVVLLCSVAPHSPRMPTPRFVLWAWERPEDLSFVDPSNTGVAYLAATVTLLADGQAAVHGRHQPLFVPPRTSQTAVIRIESPERYLSPNPRELALILARIAVDQHAAAIQIDFDARASERSFYKSLLGELRQSTRLPLGITALASWCNADGWLDSLPISEAVPMFFRMGRNEYRSMRVAAPVCRTSVGLSTDELWPAPRSARTYIFNPHSWTRADYEQVRARSEEWK
ncbi:MAG: hypothetical protein KGN84_01985 [Acidobacteriota bacterium]|nr:hypothetical protein [Acidobacteriota bacterium]